MASITMTASFLGGSASVAASKHRSATGLCRGFRVATKALKFSEGAGDLGCRGFRVTFNASMTSKVIEGVNFKNEREEGSNNARRELVFAAVATTAVAVCLMARVGVAVADEPKRGTPEAKKKYAPVCVTMPTARICRN